LLRFRSILRLQLIPVIASGMPVPVGLAILGRVVLLTMALAALLIGGLAGRVIPVPVVQGIADPEDRPIVVLVGLCTEGLEVRLTAALVARPITGREGLVTLGQEGRAIQGRAAWASALPSVDE